MEPDTKATLRFIISLASGLILGGMRLLGMITNIWLGSVVLLLAFGLVAYAFLIVVKTWRSRWRWILVALGGTVFLVLVGLQVLRQYEQDNPSFHGFNLHLSTIWLVAPLGVAVGLVVLFLMLVERRSFRKRKMIDETALQRKVAELEQRLESEEPNTKKGREVAERQAREIANYVIALRPRPNYNRLTDVVPSFTVTFDATNLSVFSITIDEIKGTLLLNNSLLSGSAKLLATGLENLPTGERRELVIQQWVNPEEARLILDPADSLVSFGFASVDIRIKGGNQFPLIESQRLRLPNSMPVLTVEQLDARIEKLGKILDNEGRRVNELTGTNESLLEAHDQLRAEMNELKNRYGWIHEEIEKQNQNISNYVTIEKFSLGDLVLQKGLSLVKFGFYITNKSFLNITIQEKLNDKVGGHIKFENTPLLGTKRVIYALSNLKPGGTSCLTIEQRLEDGEAREIQEARDGWHANFYFDELELHIVGGEQSPDIDRQQLIIMGTMYLAAFPRPVEQTARRLQELSTVYGMGRQIYESLRAKDTPLPKETFEKWESESEPCSAKCTARVKLDAFAYKYFTKRHPCRPPPILKAGG